MDQTSITAAGTIDTFLVFLIGIGPKLALVPFVEITASLDAATKRRVQRKMLVTAGKDPMQLAQFPLAVPYLLNPVGIVGLMTISAEARSLAVQLATHDAADVCPGYPYGGMADHGGCGSLKPASGLAWRDGGLAMGRTQA